MELGNLLFGHSRGPHPIDRSSPAADLLSDMLAELGVDGYGRRMDDPRLHGPVPDRVLLDTDRGVDVRDPGSGRVLARIRAYWWGDPDDPEASLPNLEVPDAGLAIRWYKYWPRDAYANVPLDPAVAGRARRALAPALKALAPYVRHPSAASPVWHGPGAVTAHGRHVDALDVFDAPPGRPDESDHGWITLDPARGLLEAHCLTRDGLFDTIARFDSMDAARAWVARGTRRWRYPDEEGDS